MKLPKRPETHVIEAESWRLLQAIAPREWIVREVSERDYGIDAYIELASKHGHVTGHLMSAQLKATKGINWKEKDGVRHARSPQIQSATANYWLRLPVPVFLFVADLSAEDIYYVPAQEGIRAQFGNLDKQDSITFKLLDELSLKSKVGKALLPWFYGRERMHGQFSFHIVNLLSHIDMFRDFISEHQNRDSFMEVEEEDHLQFRALYESCRMASLYLEKNWKMESLGELYKKDKAEWKDETVWLHELTLDYALQKIEKIFPSLVRKAIELVTETQAAYWLDKDPIFFNLCNGLTWAVQRLEQEAKLRDTDR
jgi:hypothetical protein